ncbi:MAG TPA: hypothetical protein VNU93_05750, partial [Verrucomicrobiae bacterium]|nr:hypothetical protein [Verrucomicrobiae bacterium]
DQSVGLQARMMSQAMRKLAGNLNRANTLCVFTNQIREKVGVMFGSPETQPGGRALKFYASQRLDIRRIGAIKDGVPVTSAKKEMTNGSRSERSKSYCRGAQIERVSGG